MALFNDLTATRSIFDDAFGGMDDYGAEGSDVDADLAGLDAEVEQEASFGEDEFGNGVFGSLYGTDGALATDVGDDAPSRVVVSDTIQAGVARAFNPNWLTKLQDSTFAKWADKVIPDFIQDYSLISSKSDPEAREITKNFFRLVTSVPGMDRADAYAWSSMNEEQQTDFLNQVIRGSIIGNHFDAGDKFEEAWDAFKSSDGFVEKVKAAGSGWWSVAKAWVVDDIWEGLKGFWPASEQQNWNGTAFAYWLGHKVARTDVYPAIRGAISDAYAAEAGGVQPTADTRSPRAAPVPAAPPGGFPREEIPVGGASWLPRPETILGVGYLVATVPTLYRAFR